MNRYIADLHFGHQNILALDKRPFASLDEMHEALIDRWNGVVKPGDTTYILGDFCWGKAPMWNDLLPRLNGNKVLILGNHDLKEMKADLRREFQDVKAYKEITDGGRKVILCHYPILFYKRDYSEKVYMLHGHIHMTSEEVMLEQFKRKVRLFTKENEGLGPKAQIYNVGCMMPYIDYAPRTLDEIIEGGDEYSN